MLMPSIFGENMFDDFFGFPFYEDRNTRKTEKPSCDFRKSLMQTDIKETQDGFELQIDLPGFQKEDVSAVLENGYLTITAVRKTQEETKDTQNDRYIRRERFEGTCKRTFYVGEDVTEEDIKGRFENGTLKLTVPKKEKQPAAEAKKYIAIEG